MLRNLFVVSFRNLLHHSSYTLLHLLGLTLGITCTLFIILYVVDETGYDSFHTNRDRIHRIVTTVEEGGKQNFYPSTQVPMADELLSKYTSVESAVRFIGVRRELFEVPATNLKFYEEKFFFADPSVFDVFTFPLSSGDATTALTGLNSAVLTESTARRYFGTTDVLGKVFISKGRTYTITAVAEDVPRNSSIQFDALLSIASFPAGQSSWTSWYPDTYVMVSKTSTTADVEKALDAITEEHVSPNFKTSGIRFKYWLQPLTDLHLRSGYASEGGDAVEYVYIFLSIGVFVVIIACINYINLATARAARRAKEIGIRKTVGSTKGNIVLQFVAESMLLTVVSLAVSIVLAMMALPLFNQIAGKSIGIAFLMQPSLVIGTLGLSLFIGLIGGSYPAFYLSAFNPALVLKGNVSRGAANARLRKILVSVQFAISITMIICTSIVYDQLNYMRSKDLGFNRDQVLHVELADSATMASEKILYDRLKAHSQIIDVASSSSMPGKGINYSIMNIDTEDGPVTQGVYYHYAGYDFTQTMGFTIVKGRGFSRTYAGDSTAALVNEAMVKSMKWNEPIGKRLYEDDKNPETKDRFYTVVGVIKDYHQSSLHSPITPLTIFRGEPNHFLNIKMRPDDIRSTLGFISDAWRDVTNGKPFAYGFLDDDFEAQYAADEKRGQIFTLFSVACLVISCVGLFGLAAYTTEQRAKEIGIRKVVGASIPAIVRLFYSDFLGLVAVGMIVAFPASYFVMTSWMSSFAYQAGMNWLNFVLSAFVTLLITMGSIGFYAARAASTNPAITLKSE